MDKRIINWQKIIGILKKLYPQAKIELNFSNPLELLVAVILSAQCTDKRVNIITKSLFKKYKTITDYATADLSELESYIRSAGFFHNKAKHIIATAKILIEKHQEKIPDSMKELIVFPGVARKTGNIVLFNIFGKEEGIAVDTHVRRLSQRLGLSKESNPEKIEKDLMVLVPKGQWGRFSYLLIEHGRAICNARKPLCQVCRLFKYCAYYNKLKIRA